MKRISIALFSLLLTLTACNDKYPDLKDGIYAEIITNKGTMLAELYYDQTPATVASFVSLAEGTSTAVDSAFSGKPFYNGLKIHRVLKDFIIQGGDPEGTGSGGPGYKFHDELRPDLRHDTVGILSMANSGYASNGSQFFITHGKAPHLDGYTLEGKAKDCENPRISCHTVFGKLVQGFATLDTIANVKVNGPRMDTPMEEIIIQEINIIRKGAAAKAFDAPKTFKSELIAQTDRDSIAAGEKAAKLQVVTDRFKSIQEKGETLESGLGITITEKGDGPKPKLGDMILVNYAGYFNTGELLDTNIKAVADSNNKETRPPNEYGPMEVVYGPDAELINGMKEGLQQMRVGDKAVLFVPYYLGYGDQQYYIIPPKSNLVFELEILGIK